MGETPNHGYNVPEQGDENWHQPLNENFGEYDTDIELRDQESALDEYEPEAGAKFLATDTEAVFIGDGSSWNKLATSGKNPQFDGMDSLGDVRIEGDLETTGSTSIGEVGAKASLSSSVSIPNDTNTTVPFDSVVFDDRSEFDTGNHEFVAATDGRYHVITELGYDLQASGSDAEFVKVEILKNGASNIARNQIAAGNPGQFPQLQCSVHLELTAGDTVAVETRHQSDGSATLLGDWVSVVRLG